MKVSEVKEKARGSWPWILAGLGVDQRCLINRHGPCPACGGSDRFRFDDKGGNGGWFCGGGGEWSHGDGFDLLVHVFGWEMKQAIKEVADYLQMEKARPARPMPKQVVVSKKSTTVDYALQIWAGAEDGDVISHPYMTSKGLTTPGPLRRKIVTGRVVGSRQDCLVVPAREISTGKVTGVQVINRKGAKQSFGNLRGSACILGNSLSRSLPWFVVEGYADAYSMAHHIFDGQACAAMAFSNNQLVPAANALVDRFQPNMIMIVDDAI